MAASDAETSEQMYKWEICYCIKCKKLRFFFNILSQFRDRNLHSSSNLSWKILDMAFIRVLSSLCLVSWSGLSAAVTPFHPSIHIRNAPGTYDSDNFLAVKRGLAAASLDKRETFKAELPLEKSWSGATLLSV